MSFKVVRDGKTIAWINANERDAVMQALDLAMRDATDDIGWASVNYLTGPDGRGFHVSVSYNAETDRGHKQMRSSLLLLHDDV